MAFFFFSLTGLTLGWGAVCRREALLDAPRPGDEPRPACSTSLAARLMVRSISSMARPTAWSTDCSAPRTARSMHSPARPVCCSARRMARSTALSA